MLKFCLTMLCRSSLCRCHGFRCLHRWLCCCCALLLRWTGRLCSWRCSWHDLFGQLAFHQKSQPFLKRFTRIFTVRTAPNKVGICAILLTVFFLEALPKGCKVRTRSCPDKFSINVLILFCKQVIKLIWQVHIVNDVVCRYHWHWWLGLVAAGH